MKHLLEEKIEFATISDNTKKSKPLGVINEIPETQETQDSTLMGAEEINVGGDVGKMKGIIAGETEKAILIQLENGNEQWVPKSVIKSNYNTTIKATQDFLIDSWFLEKNKNT